MFIVDRKYLNIEVDLKYWAIGIKLFEKGPRKLWTCGFCIGPYYFNFGLLYDKYEDLIS